MALETSTWLNKYFMEKILRKSENDNSIQVFNIFSKPATVKGDNYLSDMIRITVEFSRSSMIKEKKSIVIKISPVLKSVRQKLIVEMDVFHIEMLMMSDTLDKMNKLLEPKHRLSAKILYVQNENPTLLVIEDLAALGFRMADRLSGLDLDHSILALRGLARFHAASVALCEKEPKQKKMYLKGIINGQHPPEIKDIFIKSTKALADEIVNWPEVKKYSEKIAKLSDHIYQIGVNAFKVCEDEFNVINHGDSHVNNMLFRYDSNGKPTDQIFVDFQLCVYASPALDLLYFCNSSISFDVIENKRDILLNEYLSTLSMTMKQLNCKTQPPTMKELKAALRRKASYGMMTSFTALQFMLCHKAEAKDLDEMLGTGAYINPGLKNENYKKILIRRLPLYDDWGLLDQCDEKTMLCRQYSAIPLSEMALETSKKWLNQCFVENILRKSEDDNSIQVTNIFSKPATNKGDNYTSDMIRITAEYSRDQNSYRIKERKSIILKILPELGSVRQKFVIESGLFHTEMLMMSNTLNKMNKLLEPKYRLSGKTLYVQNEDPMLLVIEDLMTIGFRMADRLSGLDLDHSILALHGLARFHAASVALCEKEPKQKEMYSKGQFNEQQSLEMKDIFIKCTKGLAKEIAYWPEVKQYSEKIAKLSDHIYQIGIDATKLCKEEFNVITHGDFHVNNMLFKYNNDGKPIDHIFVDFQMCVYASPALDVLFFLNTCPFLDVMENKKNILLNEYFSTLLATMKELNCKTPPPTMEELKATMKRKADYGMIIFFVVLPFMLCSKNEAKDLDELWSTGINPGIKSEIYKKLMIKRLPLYDDWGLLDL
ncbi:PREDICTED: uncharacterized protein LOC105151471 [Acromyrmex echinatior]|uniref:uncharacterized protein LOC105151471 n=1 Tax=Acromyrmex echinatior TaxID=103372 RepID=UPI000580E18D|nr:PREDICTED: uncharacterized protein LOC105151471 [Acromyrmex echinatior]